MISWICSSSRPHRASAVVHSQSLVFRIKAVKSLFATCSANSRQTVRDDSGSYWTWKEDDDALLMWPRTNPQTHRPRSVLKVYLKLISGLSETHLRKDSVNAVVSMVAPAANTCPVLGVSRLNVTAAREYSSLLTSPELTALPVFGQRKQGQRSAGW